MIPKNGLPYFDATGNMSMVARSDLQSNLGFIYKQINYTEAPKGVFSVILLSDIGVWPCNTGFTPHGFSGLVFKYNNGYISNGFGIGIINAMACYTIEERGICLTSTQQRIIPIIAKYNGHCYVGIKVSGNTGKLYLTGYGYNLLNTPILLNDKNNMNLADAEILFEAEASAVGGGKTLLFNKLCNLAERRIA
ncbi:MAG: hypothetical protein K2J92_03610 [Muribaculaceae bacterium]|nr:hypothetical protein [Muribaculaceae bacterium]